MRTTSLRRVLGTVILLGGFPLPSAQGRQQIHIPTRITRGHLSPTVSSRRLLSIRGGGGALKKQETPSHRHRRRRQRWTVLLVATALCNDTLQLTMLLPIIHTLVTSPPPLGVTSNAEVALGVFFASKDICQLSFAPLAAILTSKTSPNVALCLSTAGLGLATLVFAEATTFWQLLVARGAQGAASAAVLCGGMSLIAQTHSADIRGSAIGLAQTGLALGILCGPLIGGLLFERLGRQRTFRLAAAVVLANALAQVVLMTVAPPIKLVEQQPPTTSNKNNNKQKYGWAALLKNRDILVVAASTLAIHTVIGVFKPLSQVVLDKEFGIGMVRRSLIISIATVTYFLSTPLSGFLSDRMSKSRLVAWSLALMFGASVCFALRGICGLFAFNIGIGLLGTSMGMAGAAGQALLADLVDRHGLGEYSMVFALSDVADSLGLIVGPVAGLYLSQRFDSPSVGVGVMGLLCLLLVPMVLRVP